MGISTSLQITKQTSLPAFGWQTSQTKSALANTALKVAGYIPALSLIVGVGRMLAFALDDTLKNHKDFKAQMIRGAMEALQFSLVLLISDLVITIIKPQVRQMHAKLSKYEPRAS